MMADSIEHVISYWIIFQKFHSPALGGFAVLSHWLPFLFFSVYSGALADRFDPRRIIQIGMLLFMAASLGWGLLFLTDSLEMWHAAALLVVHGFAGVLWASAAQLLIHDIVGEKHLHSAIRLIATGRYLGLLLGPAIGGLILLAMGPARGILFNMLIYLALIVWLWKAPYDGRKQATDSRAGARALRSARPCHRRVRHGEPRPARLQRRDGGARRQPDRRALVARRKRRGAAPSHDGAARVYMAQKLATSPREG